MYEHGPDPGAFFTLVKPERVRPSTDPELNPTGRGIAVAVVLTKGVLEPSAVAVVFLEPPVLGASIVDLEPVRVRTIIPQVELPCIPIRDKGVSVAQ